MEADIAKINAAHGTDTDALLQLASINAVPEVATLRGQINEKSAEFAAVKERYLYKHIKYKEAESNLTKLQAALRAEVGNAADLVKASYQAAVDNENRLTAALHDQENDALQLDKVALPYNALLRQSQTDRTLYESVLTRMKENGVDAQVADPSDVREVESPTVPAHAFKPSKAKTLAVSLAAGLLAGLALALALELLQHTFQTVDQAEILLGLPSLTVVPEWKRRHRDAPTAWPSPARPSCPTARRSAPCARPSPWPTARKRAPSSSPAPSRTRARVSAPTTSPPRSPTAACTRSCSTPTCAAPVSTSAPSSSPASPA